MATETVRGGAPSHTDTLIRTAAYGRVQIGLFNPLRIQRTAGGTAGRLVVLQGKVVKKKKKNIYIYFFSCHISTESWDSCDFNYVNHFKIL